jgi:uncharacterized protein (TIGR03437 family)
MYYTLENAVTGVLPSSTPPGSYLVRVTYNGQISFPQTVTVVSRLFNIATANGIGTGTAQATIANVNAGYSLTRFTSSPAPPGSFALTPAHGNDSISLWGTGGGADTMNDTGGSSGDQTASGNFKVTVGGRFLVPVYTGAVAGYPGLWVVIFNLPADITPDCYSIVQVSSNGALSNPAVLPVAAPGQSTCSDPTIPASLLAKLDSGGSITGGGFAIYRQTDTPTATTIEGAGGAVYRWTAAEWAGGGALRGNPAGCTVYDRTYLRAGGDTIASPDAALDAGSRLPLSGPGLAAGSGLAALALATGPVYALSASAGTFKPGQYTLTGNGGTQVGPFTVSANFPADFTVTNFDAVTIINRATPLTLTWTSSGVDIVNIQLSTATVVGLNIHIVTVFCTVPAGPGTFTVPTNAMASLQPASTTGNSFGTIAVSGAPNPATFTANLVAGGQLDFGTFAPSVGVSKNIGVQ